MIELKNVTKVYKSKKRGRHKALDNINLSFEDNGLVFVIGKSGSGKSTLLNLMGGLDNLTNGQIIVDENNISKFNERKFANYRNNHIGFIFQDYHLLEEFTVYENILLSLRLNRSVDKGEIAEALKKVGLSGYEDRYPDELSGGERQRVAIARAIVKNPRVILADEPTGNLDNITATSIIDLLKRLSKDCLIVIVSHNTSDTYKYADRIIRLDKGKVILDKSRNKNFKDRLVFENNEVYYPFSKELDEKDIYDLNERLEKDELKRFNLVDNKFQDTKLHLQPRYDKVEFANKRPTFGSIINICSTFLKSKGLRIFFSGFIAAVIIVIFSFSQTIIAFNSGEVIKKEMEKQNLSSLAVKKINSEVNIFYEYEKYFEVFEKKTIDEYKQKYTNTRVYPIANSTVPVTTFSGAYNSSHSYLSKQTINETFGTLIIDEDFFIRKLGKLEYVARLDEFDPRGVFITDFVADIILTKVNNYKNKGYEDILGYYAHATISSKNAYINGIIKTDYLKKYSDLFQKLLRAKQEELAEIYEQQEYINFVNELYDYLGYSFSFNENFVEDSKNDPINGAIWTYNLMINKSIKAVVPSGNRYVFLGANQNLKEELIGNEVTMNYSVYNQIFKTDYKTTNLKDFVPREISVSQFHLYDYDFKKPLNDIKVKIKALHNNGATFIASEDIYKEFAKQSYFYQGMYFDGLEDMSKIVDQCSSSKFAFQSYIVEGISTMIRAVEVFVPIFELVGGILCIGVIFILVNFSSKMISDKYHDIGILKALGAKNSTVGVVFGLQLTLLAISTIIMSLIGYYFFIDQANDVLINSLKQLAEGRVVLDLEVLTFIPGIAVSNCGLIVILSVISFIIPMIKICNIKPVQIIKTKE